MCFLMLRLVKVPKKKMYSMSLLLLIFLVFLIMSLLHNYRIMYTVHVIMFTKIYELIKILMLDVLVAELLKN